MSEKQKLKRKLSAEVQHSIPHLKITEKNWKLLTTIQYLLAKKHQLENPILQCNIFWSKIGKIKSKTAVTQSSEAEIKSQHFIIQ